MHKYALPLFCCTLGMIVGSILSYIIIFVPWMEERTYRPPPQIFVQRYDWGKDETLTLIKSGKSQGFSFGLFEGKDIQFRERDWFLLVRNEGSKYLNISGGIVQLTNSQGASVKIDVSRRDGGRLLNGECRIYHLHVPDIVDTTNSWTLSFSGDLFIPGIKFSAKR